AVVVAVRAPAGTSNCTAGLCRESEPPAGPMLAWVWDVLEPHPSDAASSATNGRRRRNLVDLMSRISLSPEPLLRPVPSVTATPKKNLRWPAQRSRGGGVSFLPLDLSRASGPPPAPG